MAAHAVLVMGEPGSGKSTSARNLPPKETFYINVASKSLPYKNWRSNYKELTKDNPSGNLLNTSNSEVILNTLDYINTKRPEIKYAVIDDHNYIAADYLMGQVKVTGYQKFSEAALMIYKVATKNRTLREDLTLFILNHVETSVDIEGEKMVKAKTSGKLIDNQISLEGLFSIVLYAKVEVNKTGTNYYFLTKNDGASTTKAPSGLFSEDKIPNDLMYVAEHIAKYEEE